jgi:hypothetical protein
MVQSNVEEITRQVRIDKNTTGYLSPMINKALVYYIFIISILLDYDKDFPSFSFPIIISSKNAEQNIILVHQTIINHCTVRD